jgi:hypothetical protein
MKLQKNSGLRGAVLACSIAAVLPLAHADVTVQESMSISGAGMMKLANMTGTTTTTVAGQRARTDTQVQFESGMMRALTRGGGETSEIVRLDQDKIYELNNKKKTYTETTFAERRAQMQQTMQKMQESQASQQQATSGVDESECEWADPKAEVRKGGEKASIAGYTAERVTITATQACKNKKTGEVCEFGLTLDQWLAAGVDAADERLAYQRAYAEKLGLTAAASKDFAERAQSMFGRYKGIWTEVAAKMKDVKGYPVKSSFALGVGGPQCQSTQQTQQAGGPAASPSIGGALGGALGGLFNKKKEQPQAAPTTPPPAAPNGLMSLMTVSTELVSINKGAASAQAFDVPAGYKKTTD